MNAGRQRSAAYYPQLWKDRRDDAGKIIVRLMRAAKKQTRTIPGDNAVRLGWTLNFRNDLDFRVLGARSCNGSLNQSAIMRVLSMMLAEDRDATVEEFERVRAQLLSKPKPNGAAAPTWNFAFPFLIKTGSGVKLPTRIISRGRCFTLRLWERVVTQIGRKRIRRAMQKCRTPDAEEDPSYGLVVSETGPTAASAWTQIEPSLDCLRAALELSAGLMGKSFSSHEGPMHRIPHPQRMLAWSSGLEDVEAIEFAVPNARPLGILVLDAKMLRRWQTHLRRFVREPDGNYDLREVVLDSLRLYIQALDAERTPWALVGFWQMAEAMTLSDDQRGSGKAICPRLAFLAQNWGVDPLDAAVILDDLYKKRNAMVHRGRHDRIDQDDVNWLKNFCEVAYTWLAKNATRLHTREALACFFELRAANNSRLAVLKKAIRLVESARHERAGQ